MDAMVVTLLVCHALIGVLNIPMLSNAFDMRVTIDVSHSVMLPWPAFCVPGGASTFRGSSVDVVLDVLLDVVLDDVPDDVLAVVVRVLEWLNVPGPSVATDVAFLAVAFAQAGTLVVALRVLAVAVVAGDAKALTDVLLAREASLPLPRRR